MVSLGKNTSQLLLPLLIVSYSLKRFPEKPQNYHRVKSTSPKKLKKKIQCFFVEFNTFSDFVASLVFNKIWK